MSTKSTVLLSNISAEVTNSGFLYGPKQKGSGYNLGGNGLHTAVYLFDQFNGSVKIQGTLELYPGEVDWVDIAGTEVGGDSSQVAGSYTKNFTGNFVWIRAAYNLQNGTITTIRYNI
jgi:hypothetical protein